MSLTLVVLCDQSSASSHAVKVLKRINAQIEARRAAGEDLPPPPKTAIAGPEYFGLNQPEVLFPPPFLCSTSTCLWTFNCGRYTQPGNVTCKARSEGPASMPRALI